MWTPAIASAEITDPQGIDFLKFRMANGLTEVSMDGVWSKYTEGTVEKNGINWFHEEIGRSM